MTLALKDGDYFTDEYGQLTQAEGLEEVLQRVLFKLTARRGKFPLMPTLGSRLYLLLRQSPANRLAMAQQYVVEALEDEDGLTVQDVALSMVGQDCTQITVTLNWGGATLTAQTTVLG